MPFFFLSINLNGGAWCDIPSPTAINNYSFFLPFLLCSVNPSWTGTPFTTKLKKLYLSCPQIYGTHGEWRIMILPKPLPFPQHLDHQCFHLCALINILYISLVSHSQGYLITSSLNTDLIHRSHKAKADIWSFLSFLFFVRLHCASCISVVYCTFTQLGYAKKKKKKTIYNYCYMLRPPFPHSVCLCLGTSTSNITLSTCDTALYFSLLWMVYVHVFV